MCSIGIEAPRPTEPRSGEGQSCSNDHSTKPRPGTGFFLSTIRSEAAIELDLS
jgi:hypothetical protein